jgi:hypothetical protein
LSAKPWKRQKVSQDADYQGFLFLEGGSGTMNERIFWEAKRYLDTHPSLPVFRRVFATTGISMRAKPTTQLNFFLSLPENEPVVTFTYTMLPKGETFEHRLATSEDGYGVETKKGSLHAFKLMEILLEPFYRDPLQLPIDLKEL